MRFKVIQRIGCDLEDSLWTDGEGNPDNVFPSRAQAQSAINELIHDTKQAVREGHMDSAYSRSDFTIVKLDPKGDS